MFYEKQARTQQLLQQNRELLEHLASLGGYNESDRPGLTQATIGLAPQVIIVNYFLVVRMEFIIVLVYHKPLLLIVFAM